jgi:hypothetical protein
LKFFPENTSDIYSSEKEKEKMVPLTRPNTRSPQGRFLHDKCHLHAMVGQIELSQVPVPVNLKRKYYNYKWDGIQNIK